MFLDNEVPRSEDYYVACGKTALGLLVGPNELDERHRRLLLDANFWQKLSDNPAALNIPSHFPTSLFPELVPLNPAKRNQVRQDFVVITWWAEAMSKMARKLSAMRTFLSTNPPNGNAFNSLRRELAKELKNVANNTKAEFDDPLGLLAVYLAAGRQATEGEIILRSQIVNLQKKRA